MRRDRKLYEAMREEIERNECAIKVFICSVFAQFLKLSISTQAGGGNEGGGLGGAKTEALIWALSNVEISKKGNNKLKKIEYTKQVI